MGNNVQLGIYDIKFQQTRNKFLDRNFYRMFDPQGLDINLEDIQLED